MTDEGTTLLAEEWRIKMGDEGEQLEVIKKHSKIMKKTEPWKRHRRSSDNPPRGI